ncbi:MAG: adenylyl-sulfate kinase [Thermoplasmata archaeon]
MTGLPGSGKSTIARHLSSGLTKRGIEFQLLEMDHIRPMLTPEKKYTEQERDFAYRALVVMGALLVESGTNVIIDATAHRRRWRDFAREHIQDFKEVYVRCPVEVCIEREAKRKSPLVRQNIYKDALKDLRREERPEGLGQVIGVDVPYEEGEPDLTVDCDKTDSREAARAIMEMIL